MIDTVEKSIVIYQSTPKILLSLVKPFLILVFSCLLFLNPNFNNYYHIAVILGIGTIIIAICGYRFIQALQALIKKQKNYLLLDSNGLSSGDIYLNWQAIKRMHVFIKFDKFVFETRLEWPIRRIGKYTILYASRSSDNQRNANVVLSAKYLDIHIKEIESLLQKYLPPEKER